MPALQPKKQKYRKQSRGNRRGLAIRGSVVNFGDFGLMATTAGWLSSRQIESGRKAITHFTLRGGRVWIRVFPDKPVTKKPPETRMGVGKGDIQEYVAVVRPGNIIFEIGGVPEDVAREALRLAGHKLSVKTQIVSK